MGRPDTGIVYQYGAESTPGTGVSAANRFSSAAIEFDAEWMEQFYRAGGGKFPTTGVRNRQWGAGAARGPVDYNEYHIWLSSMFGHGTVTNPVLTSYAYPFAPSNAAASSPKALTYQCGDSSAAREINYAQHTGLSVTVAENEVTFESPFLSRAVDNAASLDTVTRTLTPKPVSVSDVDWYLDTTYGSIGTTKVANALTGQFSIPPLVTAKFVQNTTYLSFVELVENAVEDARVSFVSEYDAQSRAFYDAFNVDVKPTYFLQLKFTGDLISGSTNYLIKHNFAVMPEKPVERKGASGAVYGYEFPFRIVHSATMGRPCEFTVINTETL
jgi:hypothetical protein